jgi:hypothetical protein
MIIGITALSLTCAIFLYKSPIEVPEITVIRPQSSDIWASYGIYSILWYSTGSFAEVKIELFKGKELAKIIKPYTENDGQYDFIMTNVTTKFEPNIFYRIKVSNYDNESIYGFSDYFTINITYS